MSGIRQTRTQKQQAGFSLLELMITGLILVVGLLAVAALFATAVGNNGRSRVDSTATMLAESVIEQITAVLARGGPASVTDCGQPPTTWTIDTSVGGAALSGSEHRFHPDQSAVRLPDELCRVQRGRGGWYAGCLRCSLEYPTDIHQPSVFVLPGNGCGPAARHGEQPFHLCPTRHVPDFCWTAVTP